MPSQNHARLHRAAQRAKNLFGRRYTPAGAPPGAMMIRPDSPPPRIRVMSYNVTQLDERPVESPEDVKPWLRDGYTTWVDVEGLGDESKLQRLGDMFGVHPLALADVVNVGQRPKAEEYGDQLFIVTRMTHKPNPDEPFIQEQFSLFIGKGYVLSFGEVPGDCLDPLRERIRHGKSQLRDGGAEYLACMILDAIVDGYFPLLEELGERLETIEQSVIARPGRDTLVELFRLKREMMATRRSVWPQRELLTSLLRDGHPLMGKAVTPYLRDAYDHAAHIVDILESYRELAQSLVDVYLSSVSNRINEVMRVLTVLASIFIPLTFLCGVYGMNFDTSISPWNMPELKWKYGYVAFWIASVVLAVGSLVLFRRLGWLGDGGSRRQAGRRRH